MFGPGAVASLWGCSHRHTDSEGFAASVLAEGHSAAGNIPGSCAVGCKGADPYNRIWARHILDLLYPYFPTPARTEHTMLDLSFGLVFLLILLHLKHFWFPGMPESTELANESSCEPVKSQKGNWLG